MVRSRRRCALRGRRSCSAVGRKACRRSQRCKHTQAPFRKLRRALRESIHWLRKPSRFPLRTRLLSFRTRSGTPLAWGAGRAVFCRTVDRRSLVGSVGADPRARQRRMRRDCAFSLAAVQQPTLAGRADRPTNAAADRSWSTVGPLVGFAFRPRRPTDLITRAKRTDAQI